MQNVYKKLFTRTIVCDILVATLIEGDVMKILKGYVFRLYPNEKQEQLINKTIGCCRFIYNYFLDDKIKEYKETGKSKSAYDQAKLIPSLSKEKEWLKEVDSQSLRNNLKQKEYMKDIKQIILKVVIKVKNIILSN